MKRLACTALALALVVLGCTTNEEGLIVNLQTDLRAGVEFDAVAVQVDDAAPRTLLVTTRDAFTRPSFVAYFAGLASGTRVVRVALLLGASERAVRTLSIPFRGSYLVTAVVTRSCIDVPCEQGFSCAGSLCVPTDCITGDEPSCPPSACTSSDTCPASTPCARPLCAGRVCLEEPDDSRCGMGEICIASRGCIALPGTVDAHVSRDAGSDAHVCALETCDGRDEDCDGNVDEGACAVSGAPCTALQGEGRVYQYCATRLNRTRAQSACEAMGYRLIDIADASEESRIAATVMAGTKYAWLGLSDLAEEGVFRWSDGALPTYTHWATGEPNNSADQDCVAMSEVDGLWSDIDCTNNAPFVCERATLR